jgi:cellulose synthase operon protein C
MRTIQQVRLVQPGTRSRVYDIDLVDLGGANDARFLVNFRYGWEGAALEEGTRTPDVVTHANAIRIFDSLVAARRNQGYHLAGEVAPRPARTTLAAVAPGDSPQATILANRLRGLDGLSDIKAAALLRRLGELRLVRLAPQIAIAAGALMLEGKRILALRTLPYTVHRTDDGTGAATALLEKLASHADVPAAETATMLCAVRDPKRAPDWSAFPLLIRSLADLPQADVRDAAALAYFQASAGITPSTSDKQAPATITASLRALYVLGANDPMARSMLLASLAGLPLQPPLFRAVRRILQVAEATDDGPVLAILLQRFDDEKSAVNLAFSDQVGRRQAYVDGGMVRVAEEGAKTNARLAYTPTTRAYLRRRGWRTLRRLGAAGDPAYVMLAEAVLKTLDDANTKPIPGRKTAEADVRYPAFADRYAAHYIMHGTQTRLTVSPTTLRWRYLDSPGVGSLSSDAPFPELWAIHPQGLWRLVTSAKSGMAVSFSARLLKSNTAFLDAVPTADIAALIAHWTPHADRLDLGIAMAERRITRDGLKPDLAAALMSEPTRGGPLIHLYLGARPRIIADDPTLFAALLAGCAAENFTWFEPIARQAAGLATPQARRDALDRTLAILTAAQWPAGQMPRAKRLGALLADAFAPEIQALDGQVIRNLDNQTQEPAQLLAAALAAARPDGASLVDTGRLAQSANPDLRAAGIALFAKRPLDDIVGDLDAIAAFLTADAPEPRLAARPIAARLGAERPDAAKALAEKLLPALYRSEEHDGLREDVYAVLSQDLRGGVVALGPETIWTLLRARSEPARRLGANVLEAFKATDFSIRQLARIGCNDRVKARTWAVAQLQARIVDVRAAPEEGFALLDSSFEDARNAGYELYRSQLQPEDWTPAALVALSDATTEPAQRFGREMIGRVFESKNADYLLSRLSEHPATGFRLLVARLMRDYVKDDTGRLRKLVPTMETTLLQVRRGRAAKDQVFAFIEEQLSHGTDAAATERMAILAPILERSVATCAIADRARTLSLLARIKHQKPELAPKAVFVPREARR